MIIFHYIVEINKYTCQTYTWNWPEFNICFTSQQPRSQRCWVGRGGANPSEARCLYDRAKRGSLHQGFWGGWAASRPPRNGAVAELRKILNFSASRTPNIVFPGHLRPKILSFIKRKIRRISITQLLSCIIITNDTYYVQLSVHSLKW